MSDSVFELTRFAGRFHPLLVHLPIGFLILLGLLEALAVRPRFRHIITVPGSRMILGLAALATGGAAVSGWWLAANGGYDETLLFRHRWTGVGVAVAVVIMLALHWRGWLTIYRAVLYLTVGLVAVAGHYGGTLTHGRGYLAEYAPPALKPWLGGGADSARRSEAASLYGQAIQPMLDRYCVSCHGPDKAKAKLRLDTYEWVMQGGVGGAVVLPGSPEQSDLLTRLLLPLEDDDHMPPEGKPQPGADEIALLRWWITAGAPPERTSDELAAPAEVREILRRLPRGR